MQKQRRKGVPPCGVEKEAEVEIVGCLCEQGEGGVAIKTFFKNWGIRQKSIRKGNKSKNLEKDSGH